MIHGVPMPMGEGSTVSWTCFAPSDPRKPPAGLLLCPAAHLGALRVTPLVWAGPVLAAVSMALNSLHSGGTLDLCPGIRQLPHPSLEFRGSLSAQQGGGRWALPSSTCSLLSPQKLPVTGVLRGPVLPQLALCGGLSSTPVPPPLPSVRPGRACGQGLLSG